MSISRHWVGHKLSEESRVAVALFAAGCEPSKLGELTAYTKLTCYCGADDLQPVTDKIKSEFPGAFGIITDTKELMALVGAAMKKQKSN